MATRTTGPAERLLQDPRWVQLLFSSTQFAWVWLMARVYIGWHWVDAGWGKLTSPAWMQTGTALRGFWERAVAIPETGRPAIAYDWYRAFLQFMLDAGWYTWFAKLVAMGEFLVGLALLVGVFTGIAALLGAFMNWNFMLAGSASTNPVMFLLAVGVLLAWKTAGWWGGDRWLLPALGTPWQPGALFGGPRVTPERAGGAVPLHPVEEWARVLLGFAIGVVALGLLRGPAQVVVLLVGAVVVASTGLGWFPLMGRRAARS